MSVTTGTLVAAWQGALAAEHEAAFGYGLLGPSLTGTDLQLAVACSDAHEAVRNRTESELAARGIAAVQPLPDYPALYPVGTVDAAQRLAVRLESTCAAAWRYLYSVASQASASPLVAAHTSLREDAQAQLTASAVRATQWRVLLGARPTVAFPGL